MGNAFASHMSDKQLVSRIYKGLSNSVIRKQPNKEWAKDLNIQETFHQRKYANGNLAKK